MMKLIKIFYEEDFTKKMLQQLCYELFHSDLSEAF